MVGGPLRNFSAGKIDLVQFEKGFRNKGLFECKMGVLHAAVLLSGIRLVREKIASKMAKVVS